MIVMNISFINMYLWSEIQGNVEEMEKDGFSHFVTLTLKRKLLHLSLRNNQYTQSYK